MAYTLDIDGRARPDLGPAASGNPRAGRGIRGALARAERGEPINADNPTGGIYQLTFGGGLGLITYLLLADQNRVDVPVVTWVSFE